MTQYRVELVYEGESVILDLKNETVGLAVLAAIGQDGKRPQKARAWALTRHKGKDLWVECHVAPAFLEAMIHLG